MSRQLRSPRHQVVRLRAPGQVAEARQAARRLAAGAGLSAERAERSALVATEAASNILRHAG